jgi:hypothetical protein
MQHGLGPKNAIGYAKINNLALKGGVLNPSLRIKKAGIIPASSNPFAFF